MRRHSRPELSRRRKFRPGRAGRAYCERNRSSVHCDASTVFLNKNLTAVRVLAQARQRGDAKYIASVSVAGRRAPTKTALLVAAVCKTLTAVRVFARPPKPDQTRSSENELPTPKLKVASHRPRSLPANIAITATRAQRTSNTFIDHTRLSSWRSWRILPPGRNAVLITANSITRGRELGHPGTAAAMFASRADRRARDERRACSSSRVPRMDTMGGSPIWSILVHRGLFASRSFARDPTFRATFSFARPIRESCCSMELSSGSSFTAESSIIARPVVLPTTFPAVAAVLGRRRMLLADRDGHLLGRTGESAIVLPERSLSPRPPARQQLRNLRNQWAANIFANQLRPSKSQENFSLPVLANVIHAWPEA